MFPSSHAWYNCRQNHITQLLPQKPQTLWTMHLSCWPNGGRLSSYKSCTMSLWFSKPTLELLVRQKTETSCSTAWSCSTSLSSDTFLQQPVQNSWTGLLFCLGLNTSLILFALNMPEFCLKKKKKLSLSPIYLHSSCLSSSFHVLQITWKWDGGWELT